jgi:hypothetical protein
MLTLSLMSLPPKAKSCRPLEGDLGDLSVPWLVMARSTKTSSKAANKVTCDFIFCQYEYDQLSRGLRKRAILCEILHAIRAE